MRRQRRIYPLLALGLLALAALTCNRSASGEPTLVPTLSLPSTDSGSTTQASHATSVASATATVMPSPTPTLSPTPTATPTPTPPPDVVIERAEGALHNGDYAAARAAYEALEERRLEAPEAATTRFGLAQSRLEEGDYAGAAEAAREFIVQHPDDPRIPDVHFILGEALVGQGEYLAAVEAYRAYLAERRLLAAYVQLWIGDAYTAAEAYQEAVDAYEEALAEATSLSLIFEIREKMALALNYSGDYTGALAQFDAILAAAEDGNLRARIQYQAAQTLLVAGEREAAYRRLYDLVNNYYKTASAYDALVDLVNSGQPVDEFQRGLVDYYNDAYDAAVAAFYRAIEADPAGHTGALHYFAGLTYRAAGNYATAVAEFDVLIDTHPGDPYVDDAWLAKAWTQYLSNDHEGAVETYSEFVAENPANGLAPEALWWAANIRFWDDDWEAAEPLFAQLAEAYPTSEYAAEGLYRAAFSRYQLEDLRGAEEAWQRHSARYPSEELAAGAQFWLGRTYLEAGETLSATTAFSQAISAGPLDYYSQRALDYLMGREPYVERPFDLNAAQAGEAVERAAADVWLADWLGLSAAEAVTLSQVSPILAVDPRLLRGQELWRLGRQAEAKEELERLRRDTANDVRAQYQLAIFFRDLGLYRSSILAANTTIRLSPARSPFDAPTFLARLAYPVYYADLVLAEAEANDLDPLLVFSLVRQESLFEGFATSYAFAHGLMQIIPSTGQGIANSLGWPGYETADLYRPFISVKFGSWYLARQLDTFEGLVYPALAAYNAGPGNARRWLDRTRAACSDLVAPDGQTPEMCPFDFYVEIIDLRETRLYLRQIYQHYTVYQYLYGREQ